MRRIAVLISLVALGAAPPSFSPQTTEFGAVSARPISAFPHCETLRIAQVDRRLTPRKLGELPPADAYHAVLRAGPDGCPDPLLVSERLAWPPQKAGN
ncbi:MAG: hypothetical protein M3Q57_10030 [Pseudomonadota bacterium]|nr:hypothetical protein [Pseudomonadota bacterium]